MSFCKGILISASPVFRDMSSLPPPGSEQPCRGTTKDDLPVVTMYESSARVLDALLRILYPIEKPKIEDPAIVSAVAFAAKKYDMDYAMGFIEQTLIDNMETASGLKALEAYTLASTHGMKRVAKTAALVMLKQPFDAIGFTEMKRTGTTLAQAWRLFDYRKRVENRLACFVKDEQWPYRGDVYQKWEEIDNPKLACTICLDPKARRRAWSHWKPTMLHEIHKAPLGDSVADYASLRTALHLLLFELRSPPSAEGPRNLRYVQEYFLQSGIGSTFKVSPSPSIQSSAYTFLSQVEFETE